MGEGNVRVFYHFVYFIILRHLWSVVIASVAWQSFTVWRYTKEIATLRSQWRINQVL